MIKRIFKSLAWKRLDKFYNASRRKANIYNLSTAKSAGVLWYIDDQRSADNYEQFIKSLKNHGINVHGLAFIADTHDKEVFEKVTTSKIFSEKEVGIWGQPKSEFALQFMDREFDLLFDLSLTKVLPLRYIVAHSNASFKVGWRWPDTNYNDLSIETAEPEASYLSEQMLFYLGRINKKEE